MNRNDTYNNVTIMTHIDRVIHKFEYLIHKNERAKERLTDDEIHFIMSISLYLSDAIMLDLGTDYAEALIGYLQTSINLSKAQNNPILHT